MAKKKAVAANLTQVVVDAILDKKGNNVVSIDLKKIKDTPSDYIIITHADSNTHVKAICNYVIEETAKKGFKPYHIEGNKNAEWIIIDFVDVVVHIFYKERRDFYGLEELWNDGKLTKFTSL